MFQEKISNLVNHFIYFTITLFVVFVGYVLGVLFPYNSPEHIPAQNIDSVLVDEKRKIDSLETVIKEYEKINSDLRDSVKTIEITRTIEVDAVKKLPLDSGVLYLKHRLREFQE